MNGPPLATHLLLAAMAVAAASAPTVARGACDQQVTAHEVQLGLEAAESALLFLDVHNFKVEMARVDDLLPCLGEILEPPVVAELHRFQGLRAFGERDDIAPAAFAAARQLEPGYRFPEALIPAGSPVLDAYDAVSLASRRQVVVDRPARGTLYFDGSPGLDRPADWPVVVQHLTQDGVAFSRWLRPEEPLPEYAVGAGPLIGPDRPGPSPPLLAATSAAALASGILYGVALSQQAHYKQIEDPVPDARLPALRSRTNALVVASAATAGAALAGGVAVAITW